MRSSKTKITNLINKIKEVLPDGENLYGYDGINKEMLCAALSDSRSMLEYLRPYSSLFEVVFMKRNVAMTIDECHSILNNPQTINEVNFNDLLKLIYKVKEYVVNTYLLVGKEFWRTDQDIISAKETLVTLQEEIASINTIKDSIESSNNTASNIVAELQEINTTSSANSDRITDLLTLFENKANEISKKGTEVDDWHDSIEAIKVEVDTNAESARLLLTSLEQAKEKIDSQQSDIDTAITKQSDITNTNIKHQDEIKEILLGANKKGLAGSFYTRKKELNRTLCWWGTGTILSIIALIIISICIMKPLIDNPADFTLTSYLTKLPIFGALVWLGWFCAKQYGFATRIKEEYAFKYAISMAFEGYKKEAIDVNEDLKEELLRLTLNSIEVSPVRSFDSKNNHATPINEISEPIVKQIAEALAKVISSQK